jgi:hypothetical protein
VDLDGTTVGELDVTGNFLVPPIDSSIEEEVFLLFFGAFDLARLEVVADVTELVKSVGHDFLLSRGLIISDENIARRKPKTLDGFRL